VLEDTPAERLGRPGAGMRIALATLDGGRIGIAAQAVGIAQAASSSPRATPRSAARSAARSRASRPSSTSSPTMQTRSRAARALTWRAARLKDAGLPHTVEGAQAKLFAVRRRPAPDERGRSRSSAATATRRDFPAERYYRDAKVTEIYEGTARSSAWSSRARCWASRCAAETRRLRHGADLTLHGWRPRERSLTTAERWYRERFAATPEAAIRFTDAQRRAIRPLYDPGRRRALRGRIGYPGEFPYTRGVYPSNVPRAAVDHAQFAGYAPAEETNERFRYLLAHGQTGVEHRVRHALAHGAVTPTTPGSAGEVVVARAWRSDTLDDMETLSPESTLGDVSVSMTI
jgi:hypothetical protein